MRRAKAKVPGSFPRNRLLLWRLLLLLLHLLLEHLLLKQRRAAARDLLDANLERKRAVPGEARWRRAVPERQLLRHREAILAAVLHLGHRLGEAREDLIHRERLGAAVGFAAVENGAVVGGQDIVHQGRVVACNEIALAGMDGSELKPARRDGRPKRTRADPGQTDADGDEDEKPDPQRERPPAMVGAMGGFGDGHGLGCVWSLARAFALGALALELAGPADRGGTLARPLLRRLLVMTAQLHLAVDALALQLLLQRAQRLLDIIVANDDLHKLPSTPLKSMA